MACPSWAYEQDYQFLKCPKRFGYRRCNTAVLVLIDFSGCDLFRMLCLPKQFMHHLPPFRKCNHLRDRGHPYKLPDLWPPNSPGLHPIDYKIWVIIQRRVQSIEVQGVEDLMQRVIDAWAAVEENVIQDVTDHRRRQNSIPAFSHRRIL